MSQREIKFRGLRVQYSNEWHDGPFRYGNLLNIDTIGDVGANLDSYEYAEVIPETVGQYTGLKDKNGVEIYEGDILDCLGIKYKLVKHESGAYELHEQGCDKVFFLFRELHHVEIIGNIHQNPELLNKINKILDENKIVEREEYDPNVIYAIKGHIVYRLKKEDDLFYWESIVIDDILFNGYYETFDEVMKAAFPLVVEEFHCKKSFEEWAKK